MGFDFDLTDGNAPGPKFTLANGVSLDESGENIAARDGLGKAEATALAGDSGMGLLENFGGTLMLVGVLKGVVANQINVDQAECIGTPVGAFSGIIGSVIPEPSTLSLVALGGLGLLLRSRRQRLSPGRAQLSTLDRNGLKPVKK